LILWLQFTKKADFVVQKDSHFKILIFSCFLFKGSFQNKVLQLNLFFFLKSTFLDTSRNPSYHICYETQIENACNRP